ncbi:MAG: PolC-type DNA polymerase III [bacterium]
MRELIEKNDFCVFDVETTGFSPKKGAELIEIGAIRIENGKLAREFESFIRPRRGISHKITQLTGIYEEDVFEAPSAQAVLAKFIDFAGSSILIAHNASFDLGFLNYYAPRIISNPCIDSLQMARRLYDFKSNALGNLADEFDVRMDTAHRALADARATAKIFLNMIERLQTVNDLESCGIPVQILA